MANVQAPNGFQSFRRLTGGAPTMGQEGTPVKIAYNYTTAIGYGDPVIALNSGYIGQATTGGSVAIYGIFRGCQFIQSGNNQTISLRYWPGSGNVGTGDIQAWIETDPDELYVAQAYNTAFAFGDIHSNVNIQIGTVNTTTGFSGASADQSTLAVTTTLPFRVYGLLSQYQLGVSDDSSAYNYVVLQPNYFDRKSLDGI